MLVKKQGMCCLVEIEQFQQDGLDLWGYFQGTTFHLGSYQHEKDALDVWLALRQAMTEGCELFEMPSDYKLNRRYF